MSEYELWQDGIKVASAEGPIESARREIEHYAMVYRQDGPVRIYGIQVNENGRRYKVEIGS